MEWMTLLTAWSWISRNVLFDTEMEELPSGKKSYGFMDFSTMSRIYRYYIDSVSYIGNNKYRLVSLGSYDLQLYEDTLTF